MPSIQTPTERRLSMEQTCLRLLARREHSRRELLDKLALRGYRKEEAEPVLDEIADRNWQNDARYAEAFVRLRIERGCGPLRIRYELQQRGIAAVDIDALSEEIAADWQTLLAAVYRRKYASDKRISRSEWLKRCRFLQQRGFSAAMIAALPRQLHIRIGD
ncbi:MAG: regulatory protein RecX [Methylococcales bacterium]|nr:regulatory protein RecX [Methylococcales bacterium]